jgi:Spy/CpxP family protein refolding chaperone
MDIFSKNKFLIRMVGALVLLNLLSIYFLHFGRDGSCPQPAPRKDIKELTQFIAKELELSESQVKELEALREDVFNKEKALHRFTVLQRDSMNQEMFAELTDSVHVDGIAQRVSQGEYKKEQLRIQQAMQLKRICTKEQLKKFQEMVNPIRDYFRPNHPKEPRGKD